MDSFSHLIGDTLFETQLYDYYGKGRKKNFSKYIFGLTDYYNIDVSLLDNFKMCLYIYERWGGKKNFTDMLSSLRAIRENYNIRNRKDFIILNKYIEKNIL